MLIHFGFEILLEPLLPLRMKISVISKRFAKDVKTYSSRDILKIKFKSAFFEPVSSIKQDIKSSLVLCFWPCQATLAAGSERRPALHPAILHWRSWRSYTLAAYTPGLFAEKNTDFSVYYE